MKIIKPGKIPPKVRTVYCGTCHYCRCEFEADDGDLKAEWSGRAEWQGMMIDPTMSRYVNCPTCRTKITDGYLTQKTVEEPVSKSE